MTTGPSSDTAAEDTTETDRLWILGGAAVVGFAAWTKRGDVLAAATPYGLTAPNTSAFHGDWRNPEAVTGWVPAPGVHLTPSGWAALAVLAAGLLGLLVCVSAGIAWARWRRSGGAEAVPAIPAAAAAAAVAAATLPTAIVQLGAGWAPWALAAAAGISAGWLTHIGGRRYRTSAAFAGRADQVLGHGHLGAGRIQVRGWRRDEHGYPYPSRIDATCGPGWQNKPGELAELGRYARELGWPAYEWSYDSMRKRVTGRAAAGGAT